MKMEKKAMVQKPNQQHQQQTKPKVLPSFLLVIFSFLCLPLHLLFFFALIFVFFLFFSHLCIPAETEILQVQLPPHFWSSLHFNYLRHINALWHPLSCCHTNTNTNNSIRSLLFYFQAPFFSICIPWERGNCHDPKFNSIIFTFEVPNTRCHNNTSSNNNPSLLSYFLPCLFGTRYTCHSTLFLRLVLSSYVSHIFPILSRLYDNNNSTLSIPITHNNLHSSHSSSLLCFLFSFDCWSWRPTDRRQTAKENESNNTTATPTATTATTTATTTTAATTTATTATTTTTATAPIATTTTTTSSSSSSLPLRSLYYFLHRYIPCTCTPFSSFSCSINRRPSTSGPVCSLFSFLCSCRIHCN